MKSARDTHLEKVIDQGTVKTMPKGFNKSVQRLRKCKQDRMEKNQEQEKMYKGERYDKLKLEKAKPPSFLEKEEERREKRNKALLLSIEVQINPHKTGRIGIKEGDDLNKLAHSFCMAYSLAKDIEDTLVEQL